MKKAARILCLVFGHALHDVTPYRAGDGRLFVFVCTRCLIELCCTRRGVVGRSV